MAVQGTLFWKGDVGGWTESECTSSCEVYEDNAESRALAVTGQDWSGEVVSLFFLGIGSVRG